MSKQFDAEGMSELFDIPNIIETPTIVDMDIVDEEIIESSLELSNDDALDLVGETTEEREVIDYMKSMYADIKEVIGIAKFLVDTSPDAESLQGAARLFTSASQLLKELNKGVLEAKKQRFIERMEQTKIDARLHLVHVKSELDANKLTIPKVGEGGVVNITQNNNTVAFSQEEVIRQMLELKND
jgi:hypothetical protein